MAYAIPAPPVATVQVVGGEPFPVHRIYCVGRNYAEHVKEMGGDLREKPFFFMKPADAILAGGGTMPYPPATQDLHHEVELVVAMQGGGTDIPASTVDDMIFGYAVGLDMTRRDLQKAAKSKGQPWEMAKAFDCSAPCSAITPQTESGRLSKGKIVCAVNGQIRQNGDLDEMIWKVPELISELSKLVEIAPGDLIFTGTPAGVGPVQRGDKIEATIEGLEKLVVEIG
jgi:fumarylpyruvate hydrolase